MISVSKATAPKFPPLGITDRKVKQALLAAVDKIRENTVRAEVVRALEANDVQAAIDAIRFDLGEAYLKSFLPSPLRDAYELSGETAATKLGNALKLDVSFDLTNPRASQYASQRSAELIKEFGDSSKDAIRRLVGRAFDEGITPQRLARLISDSGIGITDRQALALERLRSRLEDDPSNDYTQGDIDKIIGRQYDRYLDYRSNLIARSEILEAEANGQRELWHQAAEDGLIGINSKRRWIGNQISACDVCAGLDGEEATLFGFYPGGYSGPTAHPGCACSEEIIPE